MMIQQIGKKSKNQNLSNICRRTIDIGPDSGWNLKKIDYISDTEGWKDYEESLNIVKTKRKFYDNAF